MIKLCSQKKISSNLILQPSDFVEQWVKEKPACGLAEEVDAEVPVKKKDFTISCGSCYLGCLPSILETRLPCLKDS